MNKATTITFNRFMLAKLFDEPYVGNPDNTLNKYLGTNEPEPTLDADYTLDYFVMGNNGYTDINGPLDASDLPLQGVPGRNNRIGVLFNFLPFRVFKEGSDLLDTERATFGLRKRFLANGEYYIAYFSKRIDVSNPEEIVTRNATGDSITQPIEPVLLPIRASEATGTDNVTVSKKIDISITETDINAAQTYGFLKYGSKNHGLIREVGLCIGTVGHDPLPTASGLELVTSANVGWIEGITEARTIRMSIGRASSILRL